MAVRRDVARVIREIVLAAQESALVGALWLEGESPAAARSPAGPLDLHAAVADPDLDSFFRAHESLLKAAGILKCHEDEKALHDGWLCRFAFAGGVRGEFVVERKSLLAKRSRKVVVPLVDKTGGQLRFVMSFASRHEKGA